MIWSIIMQRSLPFIDDFSKLGAPYGKYSVLGNHDYPMRKRMFRDQQHQDENLQKIKDLHGQMDLNYF